MVGSPGISPVGIFSGAIRGFSVYLATLPNLQKRLAVGGHSYSDVRSPIEISAPSVVTPVAILPLAMDPDLERGDQDKDSTQSIGAKVSEERIQAESLQATVHKNSNNDNSTSIPRGAPGLAALDTDGVPNRSPANMSHKQASDDFVERRWMRRMQGMAPPVLVDLSPHLDENNLLDGRSLLLSPKQLGLSEPSHGIAVLLSLMA